MLTVVILDLARLHRLIWMNRAGRKQSHLARYYTTSPTVPIIFFFLPVKRRRPEKIRRSVD